MSRCPSPSLGNILPAVTRKRRLQKESVMPFVTSTASLVARSATRFLVCWPLLPPPPPPPPPPLIFLLLRGVLPLALLLLPPPVPTPAPPELP